MVFVIEKKKEHAVTYHLNYTLRARRDPRFNEPGVRNVAMFDTKENRVKSVSVP